MIRALLVFGTVLASILVLERCEAADCNARPADAVIAMICESPELAWLDRLLQQRYRQATTDADQLYRLMKRTDLLQQERERRKQVISSQRAWSRRVAECRDESCLRAAYYARLPELRSVNATQRLQQPKFKITHGKGWAVCEAHASTLNEKHQNSELPLCDLYLHEVPGMQPVAWEEISIQDNLPLLFQIERAAKALKKWPAPERFDAWKADLEWRSKAGFVPRLRKVETLIAKGLPLELQAQLREAEQSGFVEGAQRLRALDATLAAFDVILAYDEDQISCPIQRKVEVGPITGSLLLRLDRQTGQLTTDAAPLSFSDPRFIVRFHDDPYLVRQDVGSIRAENGQEFFHGASIRYSRLYRLHSAENRDAPPRYASEDICEITYVLPRPAR
jgi:uncharacterized protein